MGKKLSQNNQNNLATKNVQIVNVDTKQVKNTNAMSNVRNVGLKSMKKSFISRSETVIDDPNDPINPSINNVKVNQANSSVNNDSISQQNLCIYD